MLATFPTVVHSQDEFSSYASDELLEINSIVLANDVPRVSLLLHTDSPKYIDFLRVADREQIEMMAEYQYFLNIDEVSLYCLWQFKRPVYLRVEFIIPVNTYYYALHAMTEERFIGLGFTAEKYIPERKMFTLMAVPSIELDVIFAATTLANLCKISKESVDAAIIAGEILERANLSL